MAVGADDVKRVAAKYLTEENRAVAHYYRKEGAAEEEFPPELAELADEQQEMVKQQLRQLRQIQDPAQLQAFLAQIEQQKGSVPPQFVKGIEVVENWIRARLLELSEGGE